MGLIGLIGLGLIGLALIGNSVQTYRRASASATSLANRLPEVCDPDDLTEVLCPDNLTVGHRPNKPTLVILPNEQDTPFTIDSSGIVSKSNNRARH